MEPMKNNPGILIGKSPAGVVWMAYDERDVQPMAELLAKVWAKHLGK